MFAEDAVMAPEDQSSSPAKAKFEDKNVTFDRSDPDAFMILALATEEGINDPITTDGKTALHIAAQKNMVDVIQVLLVGKADTEIRGGDGNTPIEEAILHMKFDAVQLLQQNSPAHLRNVLLAMEMNYPTDRLKEDILFKFDKKKALTSEVLYAIPHDDDRRRKPKIVVHISPLLLACYYYHFYGTQTKFQQIADRQKLYMREVITLFLQEGANPYELSLTSQTYRVFENIRVSPYSACHLWGLNELVKVINSETEPTLKEDALDGSYGVACRDSLLFAMMKGHKELVDNLFSVCSVPGWLDAKGTVQARMSVTPLYMATFMDNEGWVQSILKEKVNTAERCLHASVLPPKIGATLDGLDATTMACYMGCISSLRKLFVHVHKTPPTDPMIQILEFVKYALYGGQMGVLDYFLESDKYAGLVDEFCRQLKNLAFVVGCEHADIVSWLIAKGKKKEAETWVTTVCTYSNVGHEFNPIIATYNLLYPPLYSTNKASRTVGGSGRQETKGDERISEYLKMVIGNGKDTISTSMVFKKPGGRQERNYMVLMVKTQTNTDLVGKWLEIVRTAGGDSICDLIQPDGIKTNLMANDSYTFFAFRGSMLDTRQNPEDQNNFLYERIDAVCLAKNAERGDRFYDLQYFCVNQKNKRIRGLGHPFMAQVLSSLAGVTRSTPGGSNRCLVGLQSSDAGANFYPRGKFFNDQPFSEGPDWIIDGKLIKKESVLEEMRRFKFPYYISICTKQSRDQHQVAGTHPSAEGLLEKYGKKSRSIDVYGFPAYPIGRCGRCEKKYGVI